MPLRVLIIPDKFKGTLSAVEAAAALSRGWRESRPEDEVVEMPMSDGGDGFGMLLGRVLKAETRTVSLLDAAHRPCEAPWWFDHATGTAIIESALIIGLAQLPKGKFHPFELDTEGLGMVLGEASRAGARRCLVGIGGSATNDAGFGMAKALGWQFFGSHRQKINRWTELHSLTEIRPPEAQALFREVVVAVDVQNPLLGPAGCSRVYGPQKGLKPEEFEFAERNLGRLSEIMRRELHMDQAMTPGSGAAGGLGYGFRCFLKAQLEPGFALFAHHAGLRDRLTEVDVVVTGEGAIDAQTLMGKGVGELAQLCRRREVPCLGLAGIVQDREKAGEMFTQVHALTPDLTTPEESLNRPAVHLQALARRVAGSWSRTDAITK